MSWTIPVIAQKHFCDTRLAYRLSAAHQLQLCALQKNSPHILCTLVSQISAGNLDENKASLYIDVSRYSMLKSKGYVPRH